MSGPRGCLSNITRKKYKDLKYSPVSRKQAFLKLTSLCVASFFAFGSLTVCHCAGNDDEASSVIKEARSYFEAEISRDAKAVWEAMAPSSVYKRQYGYDDYLEMYSKSDLAVREYSDLEVVEIMDNNDRTALPDVEKLAAVKVRVRLISKDGRETQHNNTFIFLKEKGRWFKG